MDVTVDSFMTSQNDAEVIIDHANAKIFSSDKFVTEYCNDFDLNTKTEKTLLINQFRMKAVETHAM